MKTKLIPLSDTTVAKVFYTIKTGYQINRVFDDDMGMKVVINKVDAKDSDNMFVRTMTLGETFGRLIPDLQLYMNSMEEPITGVAEVFAVEFLKNEYFPTAFRLPFNEFDALDKALTELRTPKQYTDASDFYNDIITV
jgi:hypothetical protein